MFPTFSGRDPRQMSPTLFYLILWILPRFIDVCIFITLIRTLTWNDTVVLIIGLVIQ